LSSCFFRDWLQVLDRFKPILLHCIVFLTFNKGFGFVVHRKGIDLCWF
jgi:hypothetical protein